jgi:hypothetical protein
MFSTRQLQFPTEHVASTNKDIINQFFGSGDPFTRGTVNGLADKEGIKDPIT